MSNVLVIDDEKSICETLSGVLTDEGWDVSIAYSGDEGISVFKRQTFDLVFLDIWMGEMDGIEALQHMKSENPSVPIIIMSGHGNIETAVKVTKLGALDFLEKPLSLDKILPLSDRIKKKLENEDQVSAEVKGPPLIGDSKPMQVISRQIAVVAPRNSWVLITGENGTGKEVVAQRVHKMSKRCEKPFVAVNCAAIPEELIESELFGHAKGAFTSAIANKKGKFELADHGTLFLDEIGDMSMKTQAKILRILQEQSFEPIGSDQTINVDVRVIAATNKDLAKEIKAGNFREDLYYRLNVIPIQMPPLRARGNDITQLAEYFLRQFAIDLEETQKQLSYSAKVALVNYHWPGNVRELRNIMERLCIMVASESIELSDLPEMIQSDEQSSSLVVSSMSEQVTDAVPLEGASLKEARLSFERAFILDNLEKNDWNVSKTADAIGIERSNLHRKLKAYKIDPKRLKG